MKQRRINFTGILIFLLFLFTACEMKSAQKRNNIESSLDEETQSMEQLSIEEWYTFLNNQELLKLSLKESERKQIAQIQEDNQSKYAKMSYSGELVSQELVGRLEEVLYVYCKFGEDHSDQPYQELLKELGGGSYRMTEEEIHNTFVGNIPDQAFTFKLGNGKRLYLKSYFLENGGADCYLWSKSEDKWFFKGDFMTMFATGEVICYEGDYYYVGLEPAREDGEDVENGIRIFRLDEQLEWGNNLLIRYLPKDYERISLFAMSEEVNIAATDYIEGLDAAFVLDKAMDIYGSAEEMIEIMAEEDGLRVRRYSRTDMMNTGVPIYMKKVYEWNPIYNWTYLRVDFYIYDEIADEFLLLDNWKDSYSGELRREYLWCEEIEGKVYTFQLFRLENYTYIFEALLLEGNQVRTLRKEVWVPQKEMSLEEGNQLSPVM